MRELVRVIALTRLILKSKSKGEREIDIWAIFHSYAQAVYREWDQN